MWMDFEYHNSIKLENCYHSSRFIDQSTAIDSPNICSLKNGHNDQQQQTDKCEYGNIEADWLSDNGLIIFLAPSTNWVAKKHSHQTLDRTQDSGHRTQDTGHRTQDTGHRTQDTGHRTQDTGHRTQDTGHRTQDTGHRTQDTGHRTQDAGHRTQDTGHRTQDTGH